MSNVTIPASERSAEFRDAAARWPLIFLTVVLALLAGVEVVARFVVPRISRIEGRIDREYREALAPPAGTRPYILFIGNSLLDAAMDFPVVRSGLAGHFEARRFILEQTAYYDWYFGLRRLFAEGARPRRVYLMLSEDQIAMASYRGDYSALRLVRTGDLPNLLRAVDMTRTDAVGVYVAHFSSFYGQRKELRNFVLGNVMPDVGVLLKRVLPPGAPPPPQGAFLQNGLERIKVLRDICRQNGAVLYLIAPPFPNGAGDGNLIRAAAEAQVPSIVAFDPGEFGPDMFSDGFHMNQAGAAQYTRQLTEKLNALDPAADRIQP